MSPPHTSAHPMTSERYRPIAPTPPTATHHYFPGESFFTEPEDMLLTQIGGPRVLDPSIVHMYTMGPVEGFMSHNHSMASQNDLFHYEMPSMTPYWTDPFPLGQSLRSDSDDSQIQPENTAPQHTTGDAEKLTQCDVCFKVMSSHNYNRHRASGCRGIEGKKTFQCNECRRVFSRQDSLNRHRGVSKDSPKKRQSCCPGIHAQIRGTCLRERCLLAQCMPLTLEQGF